MPAVAMLASLSLTLFSGLLLGLAFFWVRWWQTRPQTAAHPAAPAGREFGAFENVMHHLRQECGHHNMSLVLRFHERLDCARLREALQVVQMRHVLLQSTVVLDQRKRPSFLRLDDPPPIPLVEAQLEGTEDELERDGEHRAVDLGVLTRELNSGFQGAASLLRCTVMQPPPRTTRPSDALGRASRSDPAPAVRARLVLTVAHDLMDGRSLALLGTELLELYRHRMVDDPPPLDMSAEPIPPPIETVLLPSWIPKPVVFVRHLLAFLRMHRFFVVDRVQALPHTARDLPQPKAAPSSSASPSARVALEPLWSTGVVERRLSREETARLQRYGRRMGVSVGVQLMTAAFLATTAGALKRRANVWGVQIVDMRRQLLAHQAKSDLGTHAGGAVLAPTALGQFLSSVDMCHNTDPARIPPADNAAAADVRPFQVYFAEQCRVVRARLEKHMQRGEHLTSLIFAQYLAAFSALYSRHFATPFPCPAFSMSNIGSLDDTPPGGPHQHIVRALNGRNPRLEDMSFGVSAASSFPFVSITALTLRGSLRVVFNFPTNTMALAAVDDMADSYLRVLRLAATEQPQQQPQPRQGAQEPAGGGAATTT